MSIEVMCDQCFRSYRVGDDRAGKRITCKDCGSTIIVPDPGAVPRRVSKPVAPRKSSPRAASPKSSARDTASRRPLILVLGGVGGAAGLIAVIVFAAIASFRNGRDEKPLEATQDVAQAVEKVGPEITDVAVSATAVLDVIDARLVDALVPLSLAEPQGSARLQPGDGGSLAVTLDHPDGDHLLVHVKLHSLQSMDAPPVVLQAGEDKLRGAWLVQQIDQTAAQWQFGEPSSLRQVVPAGLLKSADADLFAVVCPPPLAREMGVYKVTRDGHRLEERSYESKFGTDKFRLMSRRIPGGPDNELVRMECLRETPYGLLKLQHSVDYSKLGPELYAEPPIPPELPEAFRTLPTDEQREMLESLHIPTIHPSFAQKFTLEQVASAELEFREPVPVGNNLFSGVLKIRQNDDGTLQPLSGETSLMTPHGFYVSTSFSNNSVTWAPATAAGWWAVEAPALVQQADGSIDAQLLFDRPRDLTNLRLTVGNSPPVTMSIDETAVSPSEESLFTIRSDKVHALALDNDGSRLLSAHEDGVIRVWDTENGQELLELVGHTAAVVSVSISPDGQRAVSGSLDNTCRVWDLSGGTQLWESKASGELVTASCFSADGQQVLFAGADQVIHQCDGTDGTEVRVFNGHRQTVQTIAVIPSSDRFLSGSFDQSMGVWELATGREVESPLIGHTQEIVSVACSPDGLKALSTSVDRTARIWDLNSGQVLSVLRGHSDAVTCGAFLNDGRQVITGSFDRCLRIWDAATGSVQFVFRGHPDKVSAVAVSPSGDVFSGDFSGTIRRWSPGDLSAGGTEPEPRAESIDIRPAGAVRLLPGHPGGVDGFVLLDEIDRLVTAGRDQAILIRESGTGRVLERYSAPEFSDYPEPRDAAIAPEQIDYRFCGVIAASQRKGQSRRVVTAAGRGAGCIIRIFTFEDDSTNKLDPYPVTGISRSPRIWETLVTRDPNDEFISGVSFEERLRQAQESIARYHIHTLAVSPDGRWLVTSHSQGGADVYDLEGAPADPKPISSEPLLHPPVFLKKGELLLDGKRLKAPDWQTSGEAAETLHQVQLGPQMLLDPNEKWILRRVNGAFEMTRFRPRQDAQRETVECDLGSVRSLVLSPNGSRIAASDANGTVIVWNASNLAQVARWELGQGVDVPQIAFSADGKQLLTGDSFGRLLWWEIVPAADGETAQSTTSE